jgi:hypothetical protein
LRIRSKIEFLGAIAHFNDDVGHVYIEFKGKFYDAEEPEGVIDPNRLPLFQRYANSLNSHVKRE